MTDRGGDVLLDVSGLCVDYIGERGTARAVNDVSFTLRRGEILGLAGESGCGKSTIAFAIPRLHRPPAVISAGAIRFAGADILGMDDAALGRLRWRRISMVFQSAMNALNPVASVARQFADVLLHHGAAASFAGARARARDLLDIVEIHPDRVDDYPHQFSGGMRQRLAIALALALEPELIIMDEPTTALDVVVQRQILIRIGEIQRRLGFAILFITHDLSLMVEFCDRIGVMYAGRLVETAPAKELLRVPLHPYTQGLKRSFPTLHDAQRTLEGISGFPPDLLHLPAGCAFEPRCPLAFGPCRRRDPVLAVADAGRRVACHAVGGESEVS